MIGGGPDLRAGRSNKRQTRKTRALISAGSSEICPYSACTPTDRKFLAQVTKPQVFVNAS